MTLHDKRLRDKIRRIAIVNGCTTDEALEALVRYGLAYLEKIQEESPYLAARVKE